MDGLKYTKLISKKITKLNEILLPSASGTIITTGNMRELPSIETQGDLTVGGHAGLNGDIQFGQPSGIGVLKLHSWIDGDTGITFRSAAGCSSVVFTGSKLYEDAMGIYDLLPETYHKKPVWKHQQNDLFLFYKAFDDGEGGSRDAGEGHWFVANFIGSGKKNAQLLRMKHFSFSPVDPDQRMPGPSFAGNPNLAGEKPGTWEVWLPQEMGRWELSVQVSTHCLTPKTTQDHLSLSIPQHASKDLATRYFLRTQSRSRTLAFSTEHQDFVNNYRVERPQHFGGSEPEPEVINISRCYSLMMSAGRAPNSSCAQEHSCFQSIDTRPWSLATFSNYLDDLGMLRPTLIKGKISVGILREWSGCTLEGVWTSASAGSSLGLSITPGAGTIFWHPNSQVGTHFDLFDANKDNLLTRDEFKKLGRFVATATASRSDAQSVFDFLRSSHFDLLDTNKDGELSLRELISGVARVSFTWTPPLLKDPQKSAPDTLYFTGNWTLLEAESTWSLASTPPAIYNFTASFEQDCKLHLKLSIANERVNTSLMFFEFSDGIKELPVAKLVDLNLSSYMYRLESANFTHRRINAKRINYLPSLDCNSGERGNDHSCEGELDNLTVAALKLFEEGTGMPDVDPAHTLNLLAMWQTQMSALAYSADGWNSRTSCVVSMNLTSTTTGRRESLNRIRYRRHLDGLGASLARALLGARFYGVVSSESRVQSSDKLLEENRLVDLHIIRVVPRGSEFVQVLFDDYNDRFDFEMVWFTSSDPNACVALANLEYHTGPISQKLLSDMPGSDSYYLDQERLMTHPEAGMIAKCASMSWFPSHSWLDARHLHLPGVSGQIMSSGSLEDISQEHGAVTSLRVDSKSHSHLYGNIRLGTPGEFTTTHLMSPIRGAQALLFGRSANLDRHASAAPSTRLHASALVGDENNLMLPNNAQGTVMMHNNNHWNIFDDDSESGDGLNVGNAMLLGLLFVQGALTFGPDDKMPQPRDPHQREAVEQFKLRWKKNETIHEILPQEGFPQVSNKIFERLRIESDIIGQFPLTFCPLCRAGSNSVTSHTITIAVDEPTGTNILVLPDSTGTIVTTGDLPEYFEQMLSPEGSNFGDSSFSPRIDQHGQKLGTEPEVVFGSDESTILVEMNAVLRSRGFDGLVFEGSLDDGENAFQSLAPHCLQRI